MNSPACILTHRLHISAHAPTDESGSIHCVSEAVSLFSAAMAEGIKLLPNRALALQYCRTTFADSSE